jgi:hypothetical protein
VLTTLPGRLLLPSALALGALLVPGPTVAIATTGVATSISAVAPSEQAAAVNGQYGTPLRAQVLDSSGSPVEGASVTFSLGTGPTGAGASFLGSGAQATATTNASGLATSPPFVANGSAGRFAASASTMGIGAVATFDLDNHAARATIAATAGSGQSTTVDARLRRPLQARVLDAARAPIEGVTVTFSMSKATSGATASFPDGSALATAVTDADGRASSPSIVAGATAGTYTAIASIVGSAAARYRLRNLAGKPGSIAAGTASGSATPTGSRFPIPLAILVLDDDANPVPRAVVRFSAPVRGASGRFGDRRARIVRVRTDSKGVALAPAFAANGTAGGYVVRATVIGSHLHAAFALVNRQP